MAKTADHHFQIHPWKIIEEGFMPEYAMVAESIFSLGNEYMGIRGYLEEGYQGPHLLGSYFNGVYERKTQSETGYRGIATETEFMINSLDWLYTRIYAGEEQLDLSSCLITDFYRELDMRTGLLTRSFIWNTLSGGALTIKLERLVSMEHISLGAQNLTITSNGYSGTVTVVSGLDFDTFHDKEDNRLWQCADRGVSDRRLTLCAVTPNTKKKVTGTCVLSGSIPSSLDEVIIDNEKTLAFKYILQVKPNDTLTLQKAVQNLSPLLEENGDVAGFTDKAASDIILHSPESFALLLEGNRRWWNEVWERSDIEILGDEENQQGIRFCIFQMYQTYHGAVRGTNIGAKGLTGEAYNGNAFWDTETYCLPFFLFHNRQAAENLLYFRYATLTEAKERATALDCEGAFYPVATISGRECCNLWQHASLQLQASTAVAYGIWCYEKVCGDTEFLEQYGLEMLIEISRMLVTRGSYNKEHTHFGFYGVMGPDEFQMMVNNNCYTNYMGQFTLNYTLSSVQKLRKTNPAALSSVLDRTGVNDTELTSWTQISKDIFIPYHKDSQLFEQHQGFFDLPHIDVDAIPMEEFPLYHHWTYDRIYRNDMIKQPDVLMFMLLFNTSFSDEVLRKNYEYYEPLCIHESSLSPSVHSILAAQLHKYEEAFDFFSFATRMDLDNYNRNTSEGIHTTSIAAAWMNIVYGFGGLRSDGALLTLNPSIPEKWQGYSFRIVTDGDILCVKVYKNQISLYTLGGESLTLLVYGVETTINGTALTVFIPENYQSTNA